MSGPGFAHDVLRRVNDEYVCGPGFLGDRSGNVSMLFGVMLTVLFVMIGGAVDFGRWLNARDQTVASMDAAVLAGGRALQTGASEAAAIRAAQAVYAANVRERIEVDNDTIAFAVTNGGANVKASGSVEIRTPFLSLIRIPSMTLFAAADASEATTARDRAMSLNREVALMLDVSGSMCQPCTKRDAMKAAARDLIDIMMRNNDSSEFKTRMALVPFSGDVRPPAPWLNAIADPAWPNSRTKGSGRDRTTYHRTRCVGERTGAEKYSNAAPGPGAYVMSAYTESGNCRIASSAQVEPLTDNKGLLSARINALSTGGGTAGHVGTAWAYYMLSPVWNSVIPEVSRPAPYDSARLRKIAILMTDGEYNFTYDEEGIATGEDGAGGSANGRSSASQAVEICTRMKGDGIEVFTVGFDLGDNDTAIDTLHACASDNSHSYLAQNAEALKAAFRDIAIRLTDLHLSH